MGSRDIAIIGISGLFPEADDLPGFYANLIAGKDSVRTISDTRKMYSCLDTAVDYKTFAFLERVDQFDYRFFNISRSEADAMDPQQRLMLQLTCACVENAGYGLSQLGNTRTGIFMAAAAPGYYRYLPNHDFVALTGNMNSFIAGRIAYVLNLHGPAMMIDTSCSSSLVATVEACKNLLSGSVDYALAGGIRVVSAFNATTQGAQFGAIEARDGKCKAFDKAADGTSEGEGGGVVLLKLLDKAIADGDHVHAVIKGFAVNQDGSRTVGLTAPSLLAQTDLLVEAWNHAGIHPESISYIEAHGTGTKLGDPIEVKAISDAFNQFTAGRKFCAISSLKTNIGHLDAAAGIAGLLKVVLSLQAKCLFPSLHYSEPNPLIDFRNTAVYVNDKLTRWEGGTTARRAGVSAFGMSGTNAHLILEEAGAPAPPGERTREELVTVSAKTRSALQQYLLNLGRFLRDTPYALADISFTLNQGRDDYAERKAFVSRSKEELIGKIEEALREEGAAGEGPAAVPPHGRALVYLFPGDTACRPDLVGALLAYPVFREGWRACHGTEEPGVECSRNQYVFAFQYALFQLLKSYGLVTRNLIGTGVGNIVVGVLNGSLGLAEGMTKAALYVDPARALQVDKLKKYLDQLPAPLCIPLGTDGMLPAGITGCGGEVFELLADAGDGSALTNRLADLYQRNVDFDWNERYKDRQHRRVPVPAYPFDKDRAWFKPPLAAPARSKAAGWCYDTAWRNAPAAATAAAPRPGNWLIVMDDAGIGEALAARLLTDANRVVKVCFGTAFQRANEHAYTVRAGQEGDYSQLFKRLQADRLSPDYVVHLGNCGDGLPLTMDTVDACLSSGLYSQLLLVKALGGATEAGQRPAGLVLVSTNAFSVTAADPVSFPAKASAFGFIRGVAAEYDLPQEKCVDFSPGDGETAAAVVDQLLREVQLDDYVAVAYRQGQRYVQSLEKAGAAPGGDNGEDYAFRKGGVYLVTGGTSGIGYEICRSIAARQQVKLVVVASTQLPPPEQWRNYLDEAGRDQKKADRIGNLLALASTGSQVYYYPCDLAQTDQVKALCAAVRRDHGAIHGVVHSAALPGRKRISQYTPEAFKSELGSRVFGMVALAELTAAEPPDFMVVFSSVSAIMPGYPRKGAYAAGCVLADAYGRQFSRSKKYFKVINWCDWQETGMSYRLSEDRQAYASEAKPMHLTNREGVEVFHYCLSAGPANVFPLARLELLTPQDAGKLAGNRFFRFETLPPAPEAPGETAGGAAPQAESAQPAPGGPAWMLGAGATQTENQLAAIWAEVLGLDALSPESDFFDLGGHSLNGFNVLTRAEERLGVELAIDDLFEFPVLRDLAAFIDRTKEPGAKPGAGPVIPLADPQPDYPLSHGQKRLWALHQFDGAQSTYNEYEACVVEGDLQLPALERALTAMPGRHQVLRTTFRVVADQPRQVVHEASGFPIPMEYFDWREQQDQEQSVRALFNDNGRRAFDLERGPLWRIKIVRTGASRYVLLLAMHHIVSDQWSMRIFVKEVFALYNAFCKGQPDPLPPLRLQYRDYAAWQGEKRLQTPAGHEAYWLDQLAHPLPVLQLPADFNRPGVKTFDGVLLKQVLDKDLTRSLGELSRAHGATLFMTLLASVNTLLHRYTGQEDIIIGSPVAGREHPELEGQIGFYVNTLAFRTRFSGKQDFSALLNQVKRNTLEAYSHQLYPFDQLVSRLNLKRDTSRSPLFDVSLMLRQRSEAVENAVDGMAGVTLSPYLPPTDATVSRFDLSFSFLEEGDELVVFLQYSSRLFTRPRMLGLLKHYRQLLQALAKNDGTPLNALPYLDSQESAALLRQSEGRKTAGNPAASVLQLFEEQAARTPGGVALVHQDQRVTYQALNEKANALAKILQRRQVGKGCFVPVIAHRDPALPLAMLAVLKTGAAFVPMDAAWPAETISALVQPLNPPLVLAGAGTAGAGGLDGLPYPLVPVDFARLPQDASPPGGEADDAIYGDYTAGAAGLPLCAVNTHRGVLNLFSFLNRTYCCGVGDVVLATGAPQLNASLVWQVLWPLTCGARLVMPAAAEGASGEALAELMAREGVTIAAFAPSAFPPLLDGLKDNAGLPSRLHALRHLILGSEVKQAQWVDACRQLLPGVSLASVYGTAETSIAALCHLPGKQIPGQVLLGRPIDNATVLLLDENRNPVPEGVAGEVYLGGHCTGTGYLHAPEPTASRFFPNPFGGQDAPWLHKTGDYGYCLPGGNIQLVDRKDELVRVDGVRVAPAAVEAALRQYGRVAEAVVTVTAGEHEPPGLVAFVTGGDENDPDRVRQLLHDHLPAYLVPARIVRVEAFPRTPGGQTDRNALLDSYQAPRPEKPARGPLADDTEKQVLSIWQYVLEAGRFDPHDNFFDVGGDSFKVIKLHRKLNGAFPDVFKISSIYSNPTIRMQADMIRSQDPVSSAASTFEEIVL